MEDEKALIIAAIEQLQISPAVAAEFELHSISETDGVVKQVARKVRDRLDTYAGMLEFIIQPDQTVSAMNEYGFFSEEEHKRIVQLYRKLMSKLRAYAVADLDSREEVLTLYIQEALVLWQELRTPVLAVAKKLQAGWEREEPLHVERGYLG